jgi:uncharacterized protein
MDIKYVENHTIFECIVGSQAYGINTSTSDVDKSGVMIPDKEYYLGLKSVAQFQGYENEDKTIYEFRKIVKLLADNNPNCLDLLFMPERCILKITPYWQQIIDNADLFISKKCRHTFSGYAIAQLNRIKTHRAYLLNPPVAKPDRKDYGLKDQPFFETAQLKSIVAIESMFELISDEERSTFCDKLDIIYADQVVPLFYKYLKEDRRTIALEFIQRALNSQLKTLVELGRTTSIIKDEYVEEAEKELQYTNAFRNWQRYEEWKKHRNKQRAPLEEKFGFDTKHAAHLVRLIRMGKEILETGKVNVDRTNIDAEELKAIRGGIWSYDQVEEYATNMDKEFDALYESTSLQNAPKHEKIHELTVKIIDDYLKGNWIEKLTYYFSVFSLHINKFTKFTI